MKTLKDILHLPLLNRCHEVSMYFYLASLKDLHDSFPLLIRSLFYAEGGVGWRIRFITRDQTPVEFEALYNFFNPISGPLFRMLYRLTGESLKYVVPFYDLPKKLQEKLKAGTFSSFYKEKVCIDPFQNQILGLQMSPFDYFLYYFALHGTDPLNSTMQRAPAYERVTSLYLELTSLYVCTFLPTDTQYIVLPQNVQMLVKTMPEISPVKSPAKTIKYLLPHRLDLDVSSDQTEELQPECARIVHWRSTSILHIFLDVWFGMDVHSACRPTVEQIRCMRVLVKQLHAFANCTDMRDSASFVELRKSSREKLIACFNDTFIGIFTRWPVYDGTLVDVMELWLSYIQPWRYQPNQLTRSPAGFPIDERIYEFISQNLKIYTTPFLMLMERVLDADFSRVNNVNLLYRPCRVFGQGDLLQFLRQCEHQLLEAKHSDRTSPWATARSVELAEQQQAIGNSPHAGSQFYVPLFSDEASLLLRVTLRTVRWTIVVIKKNKEKLERNIPHPFIAQLLNKSLFKEELHETQGVLARLTFVEEMLVNMFDLPSADEDPLMENVLSDAEYRVDGMPLWSADDWFDPALQPIQAGENTFLVRFLYTVCAKLQLMYGAEIDALWQNNRVRRKLARQVVLPPTTIHRFVRQPNGSKQLTAVPLPARICLRFLASYKVLAIIVCSFLAGGVLFGAPSYGFIALILLVLSGNLILHEKPVPPTQPASPRS